MKLVKDIKTKYLIGIDIETVKIGEYEYLSDEYKLAWGYKNKNEGVLRSEEELKEIWDDSASLYAEFSKVCAISLTYLNKSGDGLTCKEFYGDEELKILAEAGIMLNKIKKHDHNFRLIGHAAKYFDYPYLCKRYVINELNIPTILDTAHLKPWESTNLCTNMDIWKMGGTGPGSSLIALCTALKLPISKNLMTGDQVGNFYVDGKFEEIGRYCSKDAISVINIFRKIKKEKIFQFDEVKYS